MVVDDENDDVDVVFDCNDGADGAVGTFWRAYLAKARLLFLVEKPCLL